MSALMQLEAGAAIVAVFCCARVKFISSNLYSIREMKLSLDAVHPGIRRESFSRTLRDRGGEKIFRAQRGGRASSCAAPQTPARERPAAAPVH